jgi:hypothetical protein
MDGHIKYGWVRGGKISVPKPLAAAQAFKAASGRFVHLDGSGNAVLSDDGADEIFGFAEASEQTYSATAAIDFVNVIVDPTAVFRVPIAAGTYAKTMDGKTCDILINASTIQGADLSASVDDVLGIVDGNNSEGWVEVMINQKERAQSGV